MTEYNRIENGAIVEILPALPERKTLSTGQTIIGFNTLPQSAMRALGVFPVTREAFNRETHEQQPHPDITPDAVVYHAIPRDIDLLRAYVRQQIDSESGNARIRFIPPGQLQEQEYLLAQKEALAFKASGYPAGNIPASIGASMAARNNTATQEADAIIAEGKLLEGVLVAIRKIRLSGKATIDGAADNESVIIARDSILAQLKSL